MLEGLDVIIGEEPGEPIAPVHGQDRRERIEFERTPGLRIRKSVRGGTSCHYIHLVPRVASSARAPPGWRALPSTSRSRTMAAGRGSAANVSRSN